MANNSVPTLGTQDFISDSANKFAQLFADFIASDYNQTYIYPGQVTSASHLLYLAGNNQDAQVRVFQDGLSKYLRRYYDAVTVTVTVVQLTDPTLANGTNLKIVVQLTEGNSQISYGRMLTAANNTILKVENLVNYGT